jgi:large subunit GTPase 1
MRIPRKPKWNKGMDVEELHDLENKAFVDWRRDLAKIEETYYTISITPFEKNIEVWK